MSFEVGEWRNPFPLGSYLYRMAEIYHYKIIDPSIFQIQQVVSETELQAKLTNGWTVVNQLKSGNVVIQHTVDLSDVTTADVLETRLKTLGIEVSSPETPPATAQTRIITTGGGFRPTWRCFWIGGRQICYQLPRIKENPEQIRQ